MPKRVAEYQLTKEQSHLSDDDADCAREQSEEYFQRAPDHVLAERRRYKICRNTDYCHGSDAGHGSEARLQGEPPAQVHSPQLTAAAHSTADGTAATESSPTRAEDSATKHAQEKSDDEQKKVQKTDQEVGIAQTSNTRNGSGICLGNTSSSCLPEASVLTETKEFCNPFAKVSQGIEAKNDFASFSQSRLPKIGLDGTVQNEPTENRNADSNQVFSSVSNEPRDDFPAASQVDPLSCMVSHNSDLELEPGEKIVLAINSCRLKKYENGAWVPQGGVLGEIRIIAMSEQSKADGENSPRHAENEQAMARLSASLRLVYVQAGRGTLLMNSELRKEANIMKVGEKSVAFVGRKIDDPSSVCMYIITLSHKTLRESFLESVKGVLESA